MALVDCESLSEILRVSKIFRMARSEKSTTAQRAPKRKAEMQRHIDNFRAVGDAHANRHGIEAFRTEHPNVLSLLWRLTSCPLRIHEFHRVSVV